MVGRAGDQLLVEPVDSHPELAALRAHDPDAWERLYRAARPGLFRFARSRLATDEQADDAVSEAVTRAIGAVQRYRPQSLTLDPWLYGITRNVVQEMYRAGSRSRSLVGTDEHASEPSERLMAAEEADALRDAFAALPADDQELLSLRVVGGLDAEQTARVLGKRPGAVRMAQSRALNRMRVMLKEVDR